ncbi:uncharacterized protein LOC123546491 [Mercenaria mercenaria]|uniref:uncharacterized protein LOC123546491 n=1 Tax=Mercenaria mercenaria TaxID=6596 RepID=UPI00234EE091|nr:uncharacterized protein LOC123546491 [Mercenaria mercenaria]
MIFEYAVHNLSPVLCVASVECKTRGIIKEAEKLNESFGQEIAYAEVIKDRIYVVFPTSQKDIVKQFIEGCKNEIGEELISRQLTVKNVLLQIPSIKQAYLDSGIVRCRPRDQENESVCIIKGTQSVVKTVVSELQSDMACLKTHDVSFCAMISNALEDLHVEDIVNKRLEELFPNCVLEQINKCLRLFSINEKELLNAVSYVGNLIIGWEQQIQGDKSKKHAIVNHLKENYADQMLVGFDDKKSWLYVVGLKDAVENAQTEILGIHEGQVIVDMAVGDIEAQPKVKDSYPVRTSLHLRYLENSKYIRKGTETLNVKIMFPQKGYTVDVHGSKDNVHKAIQFIRKVEKAIEREEILFTENKSVQLLLYSDSSLQFPQLEKDLNVLLEKQNIQIIGNKETQILKEVHDDHTQWSVSENKKMIQLETLSLEKVSAFVKIKPARRNQNQENILKGGYIVEVGIPPWKDGSHSENEELTNILSKVMNEASRSREHTSTVAFLLTSVSDWTFEGFMKCVVNFIMKWLLTCPNELPHTVKLCAEDSRSLSNTEVYIDQCAAFQIQVSQQIRDLQTTVCKGQLDQIEADVLVNTAAPNLDLTKGFVSASLSRTAGPDLQKECQSKYPRGIRAAEVAETSGYNTRCKNIFHVALPPYSKHAPTSCIEGFQKVMMNCLERSDVLKHTSIAFPAMGTGSLGYPVEVVASEMFSSMEKFKERNPHSTLERAFLVIYDKDDDLFEYFKKTQKEISTSAVLPSSKRNRKSAVRITVTGTKTDIENAKTHLKKTLEDISAPDIASMSITDVSSTVFGAVKELYDIQLNALRDKGVDIDYIQSRNELSVRGLRDLVNSSIETLNRYLEQTTKMQSCEISVRHVSATSVHEILRDLRYVRKDVCYIHDQDSRNITVFANSQKILCDVKTDFELKFNNTNDADHLTCGQPVSSRRKEEMDTSETVETTGASPLHSKPTVYRSFSWSKDSKHLRVYTHRNIVVKVYEANILDVPVDGIVNAGNENLQHCGGIANAIAKAAGIGLKKECESLIRDNKGPLDVASVVCTSAGSLSFKCILHAVGPRWSDYKPITKISLKQCERELKETVIRCFKMAEDKELETVALPTISSGIFKVPKDVCAIQYAKAVMEFKGRKQLKEVHFVDLDPAMIDIIHKTFEAMITKREKPPFDVNIYLKQGKPAGINTSENRTHHKTGRRAKMYLPKHLSSKSPEKSTDIVASYKSHGSKLTCFFESEPVADVYEGNFFTLNGIEGVVCSEDGTGQAKGMIAKLLLQKGGQEYRNTKNLQFTSRRRDGEVIITPAGDNLFKWIFHAIVPRNITEGMSPIYSNILQAAKEREIVSLALPLLGTGSGNMDEIRSTEELFKELIEFHRQNKHSLLKVHVVLRDKTVAMVVQDVFRRCVNEISPQEKNDTETKRQQYEVDETLDDEDENVTTADSNSAADEDCVICMDTIDDAEILKCGHKFCKECIEGYFKVKQVCPTCGQVCGIITGDQPDGTMEIAKRQVRLSGYERHNSISIMYHFKSGTQGELHPRPGTPYSSITRTAFLPDNTEGREICAMLKTAFERRLVFTIGTSRTTGQEGVITWNDIHHKTDMRPNTQFGYPDKTYLQRVREELGVKGVTLEDIDRKFLKNLEQHDFKQTIN